jgi:hypothetical protein
MKRYITAFIMTAILAVMTPIAATAQTRYRSENYRQSRNTRTYNNENRYYDNGYYDTNVKQPNVYDRHRKAMNLAIATGAGAIIGALLGGKKGALIGAGAGVVTGAIITKKQVPRNYPKY